MARLIFALGLVMLAGTASAGRTLEMLEDAYEAALADVTMPSGASGTVIFKTCESCDTRALRVSSDTRYLVGDADLPLAEFAQEVTRIRQAADDGEQTPVAIYYARESGWVTRIKLFTSDD